MKIMKIEFAPLNVPFHRRLQTIAAAAWFVIVGFGPLLSACLMGLLFFTRAWWLLPLYIFWIYLDKETCEQGGRPLQWIRKLTWWHYFRNYFPLHLAVVPDAAFNSKKNYLFCCFPHGIVPAGAFNAFSTDLKEYNDLFPHHQSRFASQHQIHHIPLYRELVSSLGWTSCSSKGLNYLLSKPEGGYIVALFPGGIAEILNSRPGVYKLVLKSKKGFVKVALKNGSPLVPVISFGETDLFEQCEGPKLHKFQNSLKRIIGFAPVILNGRGFFQYSFGLIPRRRKITTLIGKPLEFDKVEEPTKEQIEELHNKFTTQLNNMFEEYKYQYLKHPQKTFLEIE